MSFLRKANNAKTSINQAGGINSSVTEVIVADATDFPNSGDFLITIWDSTLYNDPTDDNNREICKVTSVSGNTFTIERGQEDTTAHEHSNGNMVAMLITVGHFTELETEISSSSNVPIIGEDLTSQINGITDTFTLANEYLANTTAVYLGGQRLTRGHDYTEHTATQIVIASPVPIVGQVLTIDYYTL